MTINERKIISEVISLLKECKDAHYYCDDGWYSCPKDPSGCVNSSLPDECNCGAESHNKQVDIMIDKASKLIKD